MQAALDHPNVVTVYEAGTSEYGPYLAMRLVRGTTLTRLIDDGVLDAARTLHIVGQVADALDAAHGHGLVHRDVKPRNVLVGDDDHAYLADFGLTRRGDATGATAAGDFLGTLAYAAPEVLRGARGGPAADRYALAAMLFECITGTAVFPRPTQAAVVSAHLNEPPPRVSGRREDAPPALDEVLIAGLAKDPAERPPTCGGPGGPGPRGARGPRPRPAAAPRRAGGRRDRRGRPGAVARPHPRRRLTAARGPRARRDRRRGRARRRGDRGVAGLRRWRPPPPPRRRSRGRRACRCSAATSPPPAGRSTAATGRSGPALPPARCSRTACRTPRSWCRATAWSAVGASGRPGASWPWRCCAGATDCLWGPRRATSRSPAPATSSSATTASTCSRPTSRSTRATCWPCR